MKRRSYIHTVNTVGVFRLLEIQESLCGDRIGRAGEDGLPDFRSKIS